MNDILNWLTQATKFDVPVYLWLTITAALCWFIYKWQEAEEKFDTLQANVRRNIKRDTTNAYDKEELDEILQKYDNIWDGIKK
jgi:hypothetical protein